MSGIVLTFEFGLNWGRFAHDVGPIVGVIIAVEVVTAFFLEAGFLGLLVYGEGRIGKRMMLFSTCMVSLGTLLSDPGREFLDADTGRLQGGARAVPAGPRRG